MHYVADMLNMSHMRVYEVATFYTMFKRYVFMIQSPGAFFLCSYVHFVWNHKRKTFRASAVYKCCLHKGRNISAAFRKAFLLFYIFNFCKILL